MLYLLRALFVVLGAVLGSAIAYELNGADALLALVQGALPGSVFAALLVWMELSLARKFIEITSIVFLGVIFGFILSGLLLSALTLVPAIKEWSAGKPYLEVSVTLMICYISVIALLHVKDEFKLQIPFIEFTRAKSSGRPILLDTSAIIDGRILDLIETRIIDSPVVIPRFVLMELHKLADSGDKLKRNRGRRGLEILNQIRDSRKVEIQTPDVHLPNVEGVDNKLISLGKMMNSRILSSDFNLEKVAQVQGVDVINLHHLAKALKPPVLQGEKITIEIVKPGENPGQGVGYLEDGTMVVAEGCAGRIGQTLELVVKNIIQTAAGRIIFGELDEIRSRH
jgi:uncharacterized protein YacL